MISVTVNTLTMDKGTPYTGIPKIDKVLKQMFSVYGGEWIKDSSTWKITDFDGLKSVCSKYSTYPGIRGYQITQESPKQFYIYIYTTDYPLKERTLANIKINLG